MPSELEIQNASKIIEMLSKMEDVSFEQTREDLFTVHEPESDLDVFIDVEESAVVFLMDVMPVPQEAPEKSLLDLYRKLLEINNEAPHGAFCIADGKILFKDTLEVENLDQNELEATILMMILTIYQNIGAIASVVE